MTNYYNYLCNSRDTVHKKSKFGASGGSPNTTKTSRWWLASLFMFMSLFMGQNLSAQITVGSGNTTNSTGPWSSCWGYSYHQQLYLKSSINSAGSITSISFKSAGTLPTTATSATPNTPQGANTAFKIYLGHTTKATFASTTDWVPEASMTLVYDGAVTMPSVSGGIVTITLTTPFAYNNVDNLVLAVDENSPGYACTYSWIANSTQTNMMIYQRSDSVNTTAAAPATGTRASVTPQVILGGLVASTPPNCIATPTSPANAATGVTSNVLTWPVATGSPTGYKISVGTDAAATNIQNGLVLGNVTTYTLPSSLSPATTYYWKVTPYNANGDNTGCTIWSFTSGNVPSCASALLPANLSTAVARNPTLSWTAATGSPSSYDVYFGNASPAVFVANQTALTYTPGLLNANTTYYWKVVAKNAFGDAVGCTEQSFTTGTSVQYCNPVYTSGKTDGDLISNISISGTTLSNNTGTSPVNPAYTYFTGQPNYTGDLQAGASYTVNVTVGTFGNQNMAAWIDYNDDGVFSTSERIGFTASSIAANGSASFNISLACNPPLGIHRMRIRDVYATTGSTIDPCSSYGFGETEDYDVNVTTADPCPVPKNLASSALTADGSTLAWELGCAETQWDVLVQLATAPAPIASSTPSNPGLTATTLVATGLNSNTAYNAYVRAVCDSGLGVYSQWTSAVSFTTQGVPNCATALVPADLATDVVRNSSMSWTAATGNPAVTSYDVYFGNSSPAPFVVNQTAVTYTPATMDANTTYYWKVVAKNSVGDAVGCVEQSFTTGTSINYCTPTYTSGKTLGDLISNISISGTTLSNNSGTDQVNPAYTFFTGQPNYTGDLQAGGTYSVSVTIGTYGSQGIAAWVDYNDDGVFSASEKIGNTVGTFGTGTGSFPIPAGNTTTFNISLACNPPLGIHRMRVRDVWNLSGESIDPCASAGYGETEDYLVNVTTADPCPTPSALTASAATATSATLGWKQGCAETTWDVFVQEVGVSIPSGSTTPTYAGVTTTSAPGFGTLDVSGLTSGFAYEYYVRASCDSASGLYSLWAGPFKFIDVVPGCTVLTSPANGATGVAIGTVAFSWTAPAVSSTQGTPTSYDVYYGPTSGALTLIGNTVNTTVNVTNVTYGTYYVEVRPKNAVGSAVGCSETSFTTIPDPCAGINPPGDTFATAVDLGVLTNAGASASGNNLAANCYRDDYTTTSTIGDAILARAGRDVFYKFEVADVCNTITIGTCTTSMDTYMQILDSTGARINGDDDACTAPNSAGSLLTGITLAPGVYYAVIEGYTATTEGTFTLDIAYTGSAQNTYYVDADGDNYGNSALPTVIACTRPTGYALLNGDCDDANNAINPGLSEVLYNGIDDNCDGQLDEGFERTTTLSPSSCGAALPFIYSSIAADAKAGATAYDFEITNMTTNAVHHTIRNVNWFRLNETSSFDYGTTYSVRVMLRIGTVWLGYYGDLCSVTTPSISTPASSATIVNPTCGSTLATIYSTINAKAITGVTGYRYRVTRGTEVQTFVSAFNWFKMNQLPNYVYGAEYTVEVAYKTTGDYTDYGPACTIYTPAVPTINSCGLTVASGSTISTSSLTGVTLYTFEVTPSGGSAIVFNKTTPNFQVNSIPGYSSATVYSIRVAVTSTGIQSAFGSACTINVPAPTRLSDGNISSEFKAVGYPNPFATNFTLDITTSSDERVKVAVYDMIGKQLENVEVNASESNLLEIGSNYPAGVYNIIVSQGDNVKSLRMIKR
ncbi:MAG: GEVED domain-containing protein [Flavobacterium sp.]|uniref:GEVED domain-containing protein n=1 Tax=Flavobacterium sp. TaxID=239 RepID=UPI0022C02A74|nr:GEVED domain-containing protein [Flavobacterium sp.]MCZ8197535.1 GEVED domain-containing protein [Flavobacterium sp.]